MRNLSRELLLALSKTFKSERFAALSANVTVGQALLALTFLGVIMDNIKLYEIDARYISYLSGYAEHLFRNKKAGQNNERKYIGVVLYINGYEYFAPLSSFKPKHSSMKESLDFLKIKKYAVINLNNMFPVPPDLCTYVDINAQRNQKYKALLLAEYRVIKFIQDKIRKNAKTLYNLKIKEGETTALAKRCNDFLLLEKACNDYKSK